MVTNLNFQETMSCRLEMTNNARKGIGQWFIDERDFLSAQHAFEVYIEKRPTNQHGNMVFSLYFDNETNEALAKHLNCRVAVMECIYKNEGFLATGFRVRGRKEPVRTNRRLGARFKFRLGNQGLAMPIQLYTSIRELPIAEERSAYVKKRIAGWEGYLRIEEKNADVADIKTAITSAALNEDFSKVSFSCKQLNHKERRKIIGFSAKLAGSNDDFGTVVTINRSNHHIEIELNRKYKELARRQSWDLRRAKEVIFSNFAELSQIRRLRKGFTDLQNGFAANSNLEKILFEERPTVQISKKKIELDFHNELNEFQQEAVKGAMTSNDLYVIQGPPGTGKTTVISEICHQNVKAGLRTLVASQSNLAVDHALSRLLSDQDIRILRFGRTESIEEEGKKFIEENVALNWRNETLHAINEKRKLHATQKAELEEELQKCQQDLQSLRSDLTRIEKEIESKKKAEEELGKVNNEVDKLQHAITRLNEEQAILNDSQTTLLKKHEQATLEVTKLTNRLQKAHSEALTVSEVEELKSELTALKELAHYFGKVELIADIETRLQLTKKELESIQPQKDDLTKFAIETKEIIKLDRLKQYLHESKIKLPLTIDLQINELNRMISLIKAETFSYEFNEWQDLYERVRSAVHKIEQLLISHHYPLQQVQKSMSEKFKTVNEIHDMLDQMGHYLINPKTKQLLRPQNKGLQKLPVLEKVAYNLAFLYGKAEEVQRQMNTIKESVYAESKQQFSAIQSAISTYANETLVETERQENKLQQNLENDTDQFYKEQKAFEQLPKQVYDSAKSTSISIVQEQLSRKEQEYVLYEQQKIAIAQDEVSVAEEKERLNEFGAKRKEVEEALERINSKEEDFLQDLMKKEQQISELTMKVLDNPEQRYEEKVTSLTALIEKENSLNGIQAKMPVTHALQDEWHALLKGANDYDLDEIRKLYVQYANVIGTTCVASARKTFVEDYPTFDVVIIDEVSKATPPELLLPMLKGKKIILVGDHHQLPPLVGQETLEELVDENDNKEEQQELKKMLKESLFERLFRNLPVQNKTMLSIQYRMHEKIMETITPFYNGDQYSLQCGVLNSDEARDHSLSSRFIKREDHLLWFDMPHQEAYFEAQVKGGTSRYNEAELDMIRELLKDLEDATEQAKLDGRMQADEKKNVGIISFYGEQVKRIDRLLQHELMPKHLNFRTGSVDKFQGMEMDIIILSFVRNHPHKGGDIGFAKDYRRLNVALSRARELLIIVGSSDMFTKKTKNVAAQKMYQRLLENVTSNGGLRRYEKQLK